MSTRRLLQANNNDAQTVPFQLAVPGNTAPLGAATFSRADATTCATQRSGAGVLNTVLANVLRDGNYVGSQRTILLESSKINRTFDSNDLSTVNWTRASGTSAMSLVGPDGVTNSASLLTASAAANVRFLQARGAVGAGQNAVISVFVQPLTSPWFSLYDSNDASIHQAWLNLATLVWGTKNVIVSTGVESYGGGWYRCWIVLLATNAYTLKPDIDLTSGDNTGAAVSGSTMGAYCAMVETNTAFPSSPIVTAGAAITRATDALSLAGTSLVGTLFYHYYDLATRAWADAVAAYAGNVAIVPPVDCAYSHIAVVQGTQSVAQCKAILGGFFP